MELEFKRSSVGPLLMRPQKMADVTSRKGRSDVIIIGAGLSGLTSAVKILQKEPTLNIQILDANDVIGGQIIATDLGELGGRWITQEQYHISQLIQYLEIPLRPYQPEAPNLPRCWDLDRGATSPMARYELNRYLQELDLKLYYYKPGRHSLNTNSESMETNICDHLWFNKSRDFMRNLVLLATGMQADNVSYVEFMSICYTSSSIRMVIDLWFIWPETLHEISSTDLVEALNKKLSAVKIENLCQIVEIRQHKDYVDVVSSDSRSFRGDVVILAMPLNKVQELNISPPMPVEFGNVKTNNNLKLTSFIALYDEGYWRHAGYSGSFLQTSPLIVGHEYRPTAYTGIMLHEPGLESLVRVTTLHALAEYFGAEMLLPLEYEQHTFELHSLTHAPLTTPRQRIIWSSSAAAATCYRGFLGGAVQSGLRAALNTMFVLRPQNVCWQDLAEMQRCDNMPRRTSGFLGLWMSSLNLYNVTYYSLIVASITAVIKLGLPRTITAFQ